MAKMELITRTERRRRWSEDEKRRIVAEAGVPGSVVSEVARRHQVAESCIYAWRRRFGDPGFVPVLIGASGAAAEVVAGPATVPAPAVVTLPDGTRVEVDLRHRPSAIRALLTAARGRS
ncbi:MAG: transposase [Rhodospirillaceae bacterium]